MSFDTRLAPSVRPELRNAIMDTLYAQDECMAGDLLANLFDKHCELTGTNIRGFTYMGKTHYPAFANYKHSDPIHVLHKDLHPLMDAWLKDRFIVQKEEKIIVSGFITAVLNVSDSPNDWMKLLPEAIHAPIYHRLNFSIFNFAPPSLTDQQVEAFLTKQERAYNMLKGRLAMNLLF